MGTGKWQRNFTKQWLMSQRVCPSIFFCLSGAGSQHPKQRSTDLLFRGSLLQLVLGENKVLSGQPKDIISPTCPGSAPGHAHTDIMRMSASPSFLRLGREQTLLSTGKNSSVQAPTQGDTKIPTTAGHLSTSFPTREMTFHIMLGSLRSWRSVRQDLCYWPLPSTHCTQLLWHLMQVVCL